MADSGRQGGERGGKVAGLRTGFTTGACATAALKAALSALWTGTFPDPVRIRLPRGQCPSFALAHRAQGDGWAEAGVRKDAGDDPDVTHGCLVLVRVREGPGGIRFRAGEGVGTVTRPGLPVAVGEPAINPVPRRMMQEVVAELARACGRRPEVEITIAIPGGEALARQTWNPRLGIEGGLSILGTTGIVRPFSCAAWIASIHRGIDVARASGITHVAGATGATSERAVRLRHGLPATALIDMGDFAGAMLKYLRRHPLPRVTVAGGPGKLAKLGQGAGDLHSSRSQVDFARLSARAEAAGLPAVGDANSVLEALERAGTQLARLIAEDALAEVRRRLAGSGITADVLVAGRDGKVLAEAGPVAC